MAEEYLTISELAKELRVSVATIRRLIHSGKLQVFRVGSQQIRISRDQVQAYLDHCQPKKPESTDHLAAVTPLTSKTATRSLVNGRSSGGTIHSGLIDGYVSWKVIGPTLWRG
jgi:excisionase family DNA binding protein